MVADEFEGEISVRGNSAVTAQFFYVMRAMTAVTASEQRLAQASTPEERRDAAQQGRAAVAALRENLVRVADLLDDPALPPETHAMFAETLANQKSQFETVSARFEAALEAAGLGGVSVGEGS
ncbi:MAG TPA: hypothetical protein VFV94_19915 [Polyangiaceae bacterium]|nr:hypothetical protein [Polyangiaceae bacterium]